MANFPTSVSSNANLYIAVNGLQTTLAVACTSGDTTLTLASTTGFPTTGLVTIDNTEIVSYTGIAGATITGCTRGADGTTAASHPIGVTVGLTVVAAHHNLLKDEVIAVETALGANLANVLPITGGTLTGDVTLANDHAVILKETTVNGTDAITVKAPASVTTSYTIQLPPAVAAATQVLTDVAGNGVLSWQTPGTGISQLTGDVTAGPGAGSQVATVATVGGQTAAVVALASQNLTNILDNGGFEIWQRGTSFSAPATLSYTADRWRTLTDESANVTVSKETTTIDSGLAAMKVVVASAGASKYWQTLQYLENYADYRGKTLSLSVRVYSTVASAIKVYLGDGITNYFSPYHSGGGWETLTATGAISVSSTQMYVGFGMTGSGDKKNGTYYFDSAMFVLGNSAATFVPTNPRLDLDRCMGFYQVMGGQGGTEGYICNLLALSTSASVGVLRLPVPMRVAPTVTINNPTNFFTYRSVGTVDACSAITSNSITTQELRLNPVSANLVAGNASVLYEANTNATITFSADM